MKKDPPAKVIAMAGKPKLKTPADDMADVRDTIANAIGNQYTSFSDDDIRAQYDALKRTLGDQKASKLMTSLFIFNQRDDQKNKPLESRLQTYYDLIGSDADIQDIRQKVKNLGYGVLNGLRTSSNIGNSLLTGKQVATGPSKYSAPLSVQAFLGNKLDNK